MTDNLKTTENKENVLLGTLGALLFSLAGGILWFVLYQMGFLAAISGIIGVVCAIKGYSLFAKKESILGVIIAIVCAIAVMIVAWYFCLCMDVYKAYQELYNEGFVYSPYTFMEAVEAAPAFLEDEEIKAAYTKDLLIGLLLSAVGAISSVASAVKRIKSSNQEVSNSPADQFDTETYSNFQ